MKLPRNLYSRLTLIACVTIITGYALVHAWTTLTLSDAATGKPLTSTLMQAIMNDINELNGRFGTMTAGQWCTSDGTKVICTTNAPVGGAGVGQTWQNFTASTRALGTVYTNTTGKPITVIAGATNWSASAICIASIGGVTVYGMGTAVTGTYSSMTFIVPDGASYSFTMNGTPTWFSWAELR